MKSLQFRLTVASQRITNIFRDLLHIRTKYIVHIFDVREHLVELRQFSVVHLNGWDSVACFLSERLAVSAI